MIGFKTYITEIKDNHGDYEIRTHMKYGRDGNAEVRDGYMVYHKDQYHPIDHFYKKSDAVKAIKSWNERDKKNLKEAKSKTPVQLKQVTGTELRQILGKGKMNAIARNPMMQEISNYEHAYKYAVSNSGFETVEIYAYHPTLNKTPEGKIRPLIMLQFTMNYTGYGVSQVAKYYRDKEPDENEKRMGPSAGWKFLKYWKAVSNDD